MGIKTNIQWTNKTWNPWQGCHKVSTGCKHCYMFREKNRYGQEPNVVVRSTDKTFNAPLNWLEPALVFTCSWSDFFIEEADPWRNEAWQIIRQTPHLTYQILTKRPERIFECLPDDWNFSGYQNVWLGVSVENQQVADERIPLLLQTPATVRWLSCEPLLSFIDISQYSYPRGDGVRNDVYKCGECGYIADGKHFTGTAFDDCSVSCPRCYADENRVGENIVGKIDWVVTGGESGFGNRLANIECFRKIRDHCVSCGIPFFHKQNGGNIKLNQAWGGRELDGRTWDELPKF